MLQMLKSLVSLRRNSYKNADGSIDLAYVTPQLIVTSMPTANYWETYFRTGVDELKNFLDSNHGGHWHAWNLQMPEERAYDEQDLDFKVSLRPIPDHCAIPLTILLSIVEEIHDFIQESPENVALVHCKAGQGRSGSVACAYLQVYHRHTFETANAMFTTKRIRPFMGAGVSIASQVRYLRYIDQWNAAGNFSLEPMRHQRVQLKCIVLRRPIYSDFNLEIADFGGEYHVYRDAKWVTDLRTSSNGSTIMVLRPAPAAPLWLSPDICLTFLRSIDIAGVKLTHTSASVWFNAYMERAKMAADESVQIPRSAAPTPSVAPEIGLKGMFACSWEDFEGFWGTALRGTPAFKSMEVYWE